MNRNHFSPNTRILSMLLVLLMLIGSVFALPVFADESEEGSSSSDSSTTSDILLAEDAIATYLTNEYLNREDKLATMNLMFTKGDYQLYCDPFSGEVAVKNSKTGQILMTNPYDVSKVTTASVKEDLLSQINVSYENLTDNGKVSSLSSYHDCAKYSQINVKNIKNGIRVEYVLGKIATKKLMPYWIEASRFEVMILQKIEDDYSRKKAISFYTKQDANAYVDNDNFSSLLSAMNKAFPCTKSTYAQLGVTPMYDETYTDPETGETVYVNTTLNISDQEEKHEYRMSDQLVIYTVANDVVASEPMMNKMEEYVKSYCPDYNYEERDYDIELTGYTEDSNALATFHMALEYTLTENGVEVSLPSNGIRYDSDSFRLKSISILPYMGASGGYDGKFEGYTFIPDGSGAIIRNEDIMATGDQYTLTGQMYGPDYAYHTLTYNGKSEILRMPVFGVIENTGTAYDGGKREIVPVLDENGEPSVNENGEYNPQAWTVTAKNYRELYDKYGDMVMRILVDDDGNPVYRDEKVTEPVLRLEGDHYVLDDDASTTEYNLKQVFYQVSESSRDDNFNVLTPEGGKEPLTTVVYDYNYNIQGFFAIIEEGESLCELTTNHGGGKLHGYNNAYITVHPESSDSYRLSDAISVGDGNAEWTVVSERKFVGLFKIRYIMLYGEEGTTDTYAASYMGMAEAYRDYLNLDKLTEEETGSDIPLYIESFGMIETQDTIATIPVWVSTPLTTFDDIESMYNALSDAGVTNVNFRLKGFTSGGTIWAEPPTRVKFEKVLGGNDGYQEILKNSEGKFNIYPEFDFANAWGSSIFDGFSYSKQTVRTIDDRYANKREYSSTYQSFQYIGSVAISPCAYSDILSQFSEDFDKLGYDGLSASTLGSDLNSDFDEDDPYNREDTKELTIAMLKELNEKYGDIMVDGGNAYSWKYVNHILNMSLDSSRYLRASQSVPFMGIVLHGYVHIAGKPTNMQGDTDYEILKLIENGASPYYTLSYQNTEELKENNRLNKYYSVDFEIWQSELISTYKILNEALGDVQTSKIIRHGFLEGIRRLDDGVNGDSYKSENPATPVAGSERANYLKNEAAAREELLEEFNSLLLKAIKDAKRSGLLSEDYKEESKDGALVVPAQFILKDEKGENTVADKFAFEYVDFDAYFTEKYVPSVDLTVDDSSIVIETYENGKTFILNYNSFSVDVEVELVINGETVVKTFTVGAYGFIKLAADGSTQMTYAKGVGTNE